jgi:hypothetical protein
MACFQSISLLLLVTVLVTISYAQAEGAFG